MGKLPNMQLSTQNLSAIWNLLDTTFFKITAFLRKMVYFLEPQRNELQN